MSEPNEDPNLCRICDQIFDTDDGHEPDGICDACAQDRLIICDCALQEIKDILADWGCTAKDLKRALELAKKTLEGNRKFKEDE